MARAKAVKPLLSLKGDFEESLDAFVQAGLNLMHAANFTVEHGNLTQPIRDNLKTAADALSVHFSESA